ncbi:MAG: hypothetical protein HZB61_10825 [Nitrospirae bacterium]|nr:hypothetical protein [Nitrospirota bacterium]
MAFLIIKLDEQLCNLKSRFRLIHKDEDIDVTFTRQTFRELLEDIGFSSKRVGCILRLLDKRYPIEVSQFKLSVEDKYNDGALIEFLQFYGFKVKKRNDDLEIQEVIKVLEKRGYEIRGSYKDVVSCSPLVNKN